MVFTIATKNNLMPVYIRNPTGSKSLLFCFIDHYGNIEQISFIGPCKSLLNGEYQMSQTPVKYLIILSFCKHITRAFY